MQVFIRKEYKNPCPIVAVSANDDAERLGICPTKWDELFINQQLIHKENMWLTLKHCPENVDDDNSGLIEGEYSKRLYPPIPGNIRYYFFNMGDGHGLKLSENLNENSATLSIDDDNFSVTQQF